MRKKSYWLIILVNNYIKIIMIHRYLTLNILVGKKKYHYSHVVLTMLSHVVII
jgi:hypothetical protein